MFPAFKPQMTELLNVCFELYRCLLLRLQQQRHIQNPRTHSFRSTVSISFQVPATEGELMQKGFDLPTYCTCCK